MAEFDGIRSKMYKEALREFPNAREEDIAVMIKYLAPKKNEIILEIGAGSGFFSARLADKVKRLIVTDPSEEQLEEVKELKKKNIELINGGAENINLEKESVDAIWSFGAMHHCFNKTKAFENFSSILKKDGRLVLADVWKGSSLARHFDSQVTKYSITGHYVEFWTDETANKLCKLTGLEKPKIYELKIKWKFKSKEDIGIFLYKLHAMTKTNPKECLRGAEEILGIEKKDDFYLLNWPMKVIVTRKK